MKNLIKDDKPRYVFKAEVFKSGIEYDIEINGIMRTYSIPACRVPRGVKERNYNSPWLHFTNTLYEENGPAYFEDRRQPNKDYIPGIHESVSVDAQLVALGIVKIREKGQTEWMNPDDMLIKENVKVIDTDRIKPGQLWSLTIDGDPRFNNTTIMIIPSHYGTALRFIYQTNVMYTEGYSQTETAEGVIEFMNRKGELNNLDNVHITLLQDNTNPSGAIMDRSKDNEYIYPRTYPIGYKEIYPPIEFTKRNKCEYDDPNEEYYE